MELKDVVAIAGAPGLYKVIGQRKNGLIVESLDGAARKIATSPTQKISVLSDVAIFTENEEVKLSEVLLEIKKQTEGGLTVPDKKADDNSLKSFLGAIVPKYDKERVYVSDMKKLVGWWNILKDQIDFEKLEAKDEEKTESTESAVGEKKEVKKETKKTPKAQVKQAAPKVNTKGKAAKSISTPRKAQ
ncbi:MAG: DUF5606 domain-containing protein [Bacteroidetes bacterium]|nr:DUF5606 domain-containing protein [Bacteroidota bacterium]